MHTGDERAFSSLIQQKSGTQVEVALETEKIHSNLTPMMKPHGHIPSPTTPPSPPPLPPRALPGQTKSRHFHFNYSVFICRLLSNPLLAQKPNKNTAAPTKLLTEGW